MTNSTAATPVIPDWKNARSIDQPHFAFWMSALTSEGLHAKADIARLLAMLTQREIADDPSEQAVADAITAAVVWYRAPLDKRAAAEAVLRRHVGNLLHQPEEVAT